MSEKAIFEKAEPYRYLLPIYTVEEGKGIELINNLPHYGDQYLEVNMLRGSKIKGENVLPKIDGVLVEQLLAICVDHLKSVNVGDLASRETSLAITAIEEAQLRLLQREINRRKQNTLGTYQK